MATVAELAAMDHQEPGYLVLVQGLAYGWTNHPDLLGTTFIGGSDGRTILGGLEIPTPEEAIDPVTGQFRTTDLVLKIHDDEDGTLATLFGTEPAPQDIERLARTVEAGDTALGAGDVKVGSGTLSNGDTTDCYIGIERIGSSGERNQWFPLPGVSMPGPQHFVAEDGSSPLITVSDDPVTHEGRLVVVYRLLRDHTDGTTGASSWPSLANQFAQAGKTVQFVGTMRGRAVIGPDRTWSIRCAGLGSLTEKILNGSASPDWLPCETKVDLSTSGAHREDQVSVAFGSFANPNNNPTTYGATIWQTNLTDGTPAELADQVGDIVQDCADGTTTNAGSGTFESFPRGASFGLDTVWIRGGSDERHDMAIVLHKKVWAALGWDVEGVDPLGMASNGVQFSADLKAIAPQLQNMGIESRRDGYVCGVFRTAPPGDPFQISDNDEIPREYHPPWSNPQFIEGGGGQEVEIHADTYVEGETHLTVPITLVDGQAADAARIVLLRGRAMFEDDSEPREYIQAAKVVWKTDTTSGSKIRESTTSGWPVVKILNLIDPRPLGLNFRPISTSGIWVTDRLEMAFLGSLSEADGGDSFGDAHVELMALLLSTGTADDWSSSGDNQPSSVLDPNAGDRRIASMGLAVPTDLVAHEREFADAFDSVPGGKFGPLCKVRSAAHGTVSAADWVRGLLEPRNLGWRFHDAKLSVFPIASVPSGDEVDVTIVEGDFLSLPKQRPEALGQFARYRVEYGQDPMGDGSLAFSRGARDAGALTRRTRAEVSLTGRGLLPAEWMQDPDKDPDWAREGTGAVGAWKQRIGELWAVRVAAFWASRNFVLSGVHVRPAIGIQTRMGSVVMLSHSAPLNPVQGSYGITRGIGRVVRRRLQPDGDAVLDVLMYGETLRPQASTPHYAPIAYAGGAWSDGYNPSTRVLYCASDWRQSGDSAVEDVRGFSEPDWTGSLGGDTRVRLYRIKRQNIDSTHIDIEAGPVGTVESVDVENNTITFESPGLTGYKQDSEYLVVLEDYDDSNQGTWVKTLFGVWCEDDGTFGSGPTNAKRWVLP